MKPFAILPMLLATAVAANAARKINLSATVQEYVAEGMVCQQLLFNDDKGPISLELPPKWAYRGSANRLQLIPPDKPFAEGTIEAAPLDTPHPLDAAAMQAITDHALASVPPGAQAVALIGTVENSFFIEGNPAYDVIISYKTLGETFRRTVTVVNSPDTQFIFRFTAREADFQALNKVFRRALMSWQPARSQKAADTPQAAEAN